MPQRKSKRSNRSPSDFRTENWISARNPGTSPPKDLTKTLDQLWRITAQTYEFEMQRSIFHAQTLKECQQLWKILNQPNSRSRLLSTYLKSESAQWAYLLLFWIPNILRCWSALKQAPNDRLGQTETWVDVGCGPFSASCAQLIASMNHEQLPESLLVLGIDREPGLPHKAMPIIKKWASTVFSADHETRVNLSFMNQDWFHFQDLPQPHRLFATNILNEWERTPETFFNVWKKPGLISGVTQTLILEPAKPHVFQQLLRARKKLLSLGHSLLSPCTHANSCPLEGKKKEWCYFIVELPDKLEWAKWSRPLFDNEHKRHLHYSYLLTQYDNDLETTHLYSHRVISDAVPIRHGAKGFYVCGDNGRHFVKQLTPRAPKWQRGDLVQPKK